MNASQLLGKRVALMISDPWDFGTECGVGPFHGKISDADSERIADVDIERVLVTFEHSIKYQMVVYLSAICHIRHEGVSFDDLRRKMPVSVNITLLPIRDKRFIDIKDADFRKGFAATGSIELV